MFPTGDLQPTLSKFRSRAKAIADAGMGVEFACVHYQRRCLSLFSYRAQLQRPPNAGHHERAAIAAITSAPNNGFDGLTGANVHEVGLPNLRPVRATCLGALLRAALVHATTWREWIAKLERVAHDSLDLRDASLAAKGSWAPPFWDSPAFAANLNWAAEGFPTIDGARSASRSFITRVASCPSRHW